MTKARYIVGVDVGGRFQVVGVSPNRLPPAGLQRPKGGVGEHVVGAAPRAAHLADGLLGEDGGERAADRPKRAGGRKCTRRMSEEERG